MKSVTVDVQTGAFTDQIYEEAQEAAATLAAMIRAKRNELLARSDYTQLPDAPGPTSAWAAYRQALRDLPEQPGFPDTPVWPDPPA